MGGTPPKCARPERHDAITHLAWLTEQSFDERLQLNQQDDHGNNDLT